MILQASDSVRGGSTFVAGATVTLTCGFPQGSPSSVTYKWYFASTEISGQLSSTYTQTNVMPARSGMYRCEVTDTPPTSANYTFAATRSASLSITIQSKGMVLLCNLQFFLQTRRHTLTRKHIAWSLWCAAIEVQCMFAKSK